MFPRCSVVTLITTLTFQVPALAQITTNIPTATCQEQPRTEYSPSFISKLKHKIDNEPGYAEKRSQALDSFDRSQAAILSAYAAGLKALAREKDALLSLRSRAEKLSTDTPVAADKKGNVRSLLDASTLDVKVTPEIAASTVKWEEFAFHVQRYNKIEADMKELVSNNCEIIAFRNEAGPRHP